MSLGFQVAFVVLLNQDYQLLAFVSLSFACLTGWYWVRPKVYSAVVGLLLRPFPKLALKHAKLESWLEFDLEWDDQRI